MSTFQFWKKVILFTAIVVFTKIFTSFLSATAQFYSIRQIWKTTPFETLRDADLSSLHTPYFQVLFLILAWVPILVSFWAGYSIAKKLPRKRVLGGASVGFLSQMVQVILLLLLMGIFALKPYSILGEEFSKQPRATRDYMISKQLSVFTGRVVLQLQLSIFYAVISGAGGLVATHLQKVSLKKQSKLQSRK